jgi:Protein of unknown function (DUF1320)
MSYLTPTQFKARAIPSGSFDGLDPDVVQTALDVASSEIDAALRPHHSLPMSTGSLGSELAVLYDAEMVIASYRLMLLVGFKPDVDGSADAVLKERYNEVTGFDGRPGALLPRIAKGQYLFSSGADATSSTDEGAPIVRAASPTRNTPTSTHRYIDGRRVI